MPKTRAQLREMGRRGGRARAEKLSPERRAAIAAYARSCKGDNSGPYRKHPKSYQVQGISKENRDLLSDYGNGSVSEGFRRLMRTYGDAIRREIIEHGQGGRTLEEDSAQREDDVLIDVLNV